MSKKTGIIIDYCQGCGKVKRHEKVGKLELPLIEDQKRYVWRCTECGTLWFVFRHKQVYWR